MANLKRSTLEKQLAFHKAQRVQYDPYFKQLREHFYPSAGRFDADKPNEVLKRYSKLVDTSPVEARKTLQSGMMAGSTSPALPWFRLATPDAGLMEFAPVKEYLAIVERLMREVFNRSNLYQALPKIYGEVGTFATACMAVVPDFNSVVRFQPFTMGQYYIAANSLGIVDTFYFVTKLQVRQVIGLNDRLGGGKVSKNVQAKFKAKEFYDWIDVVHCVQPNLDRDFDSPFAKDKAFISAYYEVGGDNEDLLAVSGYDKFPIIAPRWEVNDGDVMGTDCPGMASLPDAKQLQVQQKRKAKAVAGMVSPPTQSPAGQGKKLQYNILPGSHSTYDPNMGGEGISTIYQTSPRINELLEDIGETRKRIETAWYSDLFKMMLMSDRRQITAREVDERSDEKLLMIGPALQRMQKDLNDKLIDVTFHYMNQAGVLPPAPPELEGIELKVEYISSLAQSQQAAGFTALSGIARFTGELANLSGDISVWDKIDKDQVIDEAGEMLGVAPKVVKTDDVVAQEREIKQQAQAQAQAIEAGATMAKASKDSTQAQKNRIESEE